MQKSPTNHNQFDDMQQSRMDALLSCHTKFGHEIEFNILSWFISYDFHSKSPLNLSIIHHISSMHQFLNIRYPALISCLTFKIESTTFIDFNIHKLELVGGAGASSVVGSTWIFPEKRSFIVKC